MFYSYTRSEHKNMLDRFFIHQINAPSSCCYLSKVLLQKRHGAMQKLFIKKRKKRKKKMSWEKNGQVSEISKTMGTQMPAWKKRKKEMNKIAPVLSQKKFQVSRERYVFKGQSRIRLATTYIHLIYPHTCTSWFDCMTQLSLDSRFDFTIYALQVCSSFLPTYKLHISLSGCWR